MVASPAASLPATPTVAASLPATPTAAATTTTVAAAAAEEGKEEEAERVGEATRAEEAEEAEEGQEEETPSDAAKASDLLKWKEVGLRGAFFTVTCRSARIGSFKVTPTDRVLFSCEGIMIHVRIPFPSVQDRSRLTVGASFPLFFLSHRCRC